MRVVFFTYFTSGTCHSAAELELIQDHIDAGDDVELIYCDSEASCGCEPNPGRQWMRCFACKRQTRHAHGLIVPEPPSIPYGAFLTANYQDEQNKILTRPRSTQENLRSLMLDNFDIGMGVLSSLMTLTRDANVNPSDHPEWTRNLLATSFRVYNAFSNYFSRQSCDRIYLFNARFATSRAAFAAAKAANINVHVVEQGQDREHYSVLVNATPHDLNYFKKWIEDIWAKGGEHREEEGGVFFEDRAAGVDFAWFQSMISRQIAGLLPEVWNSSKKNVVIFNSSEDEFSAVGDEWQNPLYQDQLAGIRKIAACAGQYPDTHFYVRMHPYLLDVDTEMTRNLRALDGKGVTIIPPESKISSYALLNAADKIITFGSTVGIEATYWGKASILLGQSFYRHLGAVHIPKSHEHLLEMLASDLPPADRKGALKYGFFMKHYGVPYKRVHSQGDTLLYNGQDILGDPLTARLLRARRSMLKFFGRHPGHTGSGFEQKSKQDKQIQVGSKG